MKKSHKIVSGLVFSALLFSGLGAGASLVLAETPSQIQAAKVSITQAKKVALKEAKTGTVISADFESKVKGASYYDVTVIDDTVEKEYRVDAKSGKVLASQTERLDLDDDAHVLRSSNLALTMEEAEKMLLDKHKGATIYEEELEEDDGQIVYKFSALKGKQKIKFIVDATNKTVLRAK